MLEERSVDSCDDATNTSPAATTHLQQRSAGSCDDATDTVAHPLQRRIACRNSAVHRHAALVAAQCHPMQPSCACCNRVQFCCCPAQQIDAPLVAAQCIGATCRSAVQFLLQRSAACCGATELVAAHDNRLQRSATGCNDGLCVATDHSPLQQTAARRCCGDSHAAQHRLSQCSHSAPQIAARLVAVQRSLMQRRAVRCNRAQPFATDRSPVQPVAASAAQRSSMVTAQRARSVAARDNLLQCMTTCCNRPQPVATDHSPVQPGAAGAAQRSRHRRSAAGAPAQQHRSAAAQRRCRRRL